MAYQVTGEGPVDLILTPGFISHLDLQWESVGYRRFVRQLAVFARVIRSHKRGTGLSDPVAAAPAREQRVGDLGAVLDAADHIPGAQWTLLRGHCWPRLSACGRPPQTCWPRAVRP